MKIVVSMLIICLYLGAYEYNTMLLKIQSSIYPKLIFFDKNIHANIPDQIVDFYIVCNKIDTFSAEYFKEKLYKNYATGLEGFKFAIEILNTNQLFTDKKVIEKIDALYIMKLEEEEMKKVAKMIENKSIYSFTYAKEDLFYGFLFNISLKRDVEIYIYKKVLLDNRFDFIDTLFKVAKIVE